MTSQTSITARQSHPGAPALLARSTPVQMNGQDTIMWMPGGVHLIHAGLGNAKAEIWVKVDRDGAAAVQSSFAHYLKEYAPQKAFFDKEHEGKDATMWPSEFFWSDSPRPGIYARGEITNLGRELIEGKVQRGFSPEFYTEAHAHLPKRAALKAGQTYTVPDGLPGSKSRPAGITHISFPAAGGFTNFPAFRDNLPLWAKHAGAPSTAGTHTTTTMKKSKAELEAEIQQCNTDIAEIQARDQSLAEVQAALQTRNNDLELLNSKLEACMAEERAANAEREMQGRRAADAQAAVAAAVARGAIGPKEEALKAHWVKKITEDPKEAEILRQMRGSLTLSPSPDRPPITTRGPALIPRVEIYREDSDTVLRTLASISARQHAGGGLPYSQRVEPAREFAAIYAREIIPRLKAGEDVPLKAANTLGTLAQTLVAVRTLELLAQELPMLTAISADMSDQVVRYGETLYTRYVGIPSVATYNTTTGFATPSDATTTDVGITYNQWKAVPIKFMGHEISGSVRRLFDELAPAQAHALGDNVVDYVMALITAANFTNTATTSALVDFDRSVVTAIGSALRLRGVPQGSMNRSLLLNSEYFGELANDPAIVSLAAFRREDIITEGVLPSVHGFKVIDAPTLPTTGNLAGFGFSKSALVLGTRLSSDYIGALPGAAHGRLTVVTTPGGFSANLVEYVDHTGVAAWSRLDIIYGASKGQINAGQLLLSA